MRREVGGRAVRARNVRFVDVVVKAASKVAGAWWQLGTLVSQTGAAHLPMVRAKAKTRRLLYVMVTDVALTVRLVK